MDFFDMYRRARRNRIVRSVSHQDWIAERRAEWGENSPAFDNPTTKGFEVYDADEDDEAIKPEIVCNYHEFTVPLVDDGKCVNCAKDFSKVRGEKWRMISDEDGSQFKFFSSSGVQTGKTRCRMVMVDEVGDVDFEMFKDVDVPELERKWLEKFKGIPQTFESREKDCD
jgi:hypothetical protein